MDLACLGEILIDFLTFIWMFFWSSLLIFL